MSNEVSEEEICRNKESSAETHHSKPFKSSEETDQALLQTPIKERAV
jgi:hypothetical protein